MPVRPSQRPDAVQNRPTQDIVGKLWHLCNILRDSGITYPEYVTELTFLLFLRMAEETGTERDLPRGYRWHDLAKKSPGQQFAFYTTLLRRLGSATRGRVRDIFADAETALTNPAHLELLVREFGIINWYLAREEAALADVYEGLLEKNSTESKAGAGQYFTPRPLIESIVSLVKPTAGEVIQDPACGTAGFLIAADRHIKSATNDLKDLNSRERSFHHNEAFVGVELVPKTHRLALMNAMLHGINSPILLGDALGVAGAGLAPADVIITNPPFGTKKGGGLPTRTDFEWRVSNKQLCFLQHIYRGLRPGGRAAVVMPDLQGGIAQDVCGDLMEKCNLHTILRLPTGIFYAAGVKTNVLFFTRGHRKKGNTEAVWVYDLRSDMPAFGKRTPFTRKHLAEFEAAFGNDPTGASPRNTTDRFRLFTRAEISKRGDNLDLSWESQQSLEVRPKAQRPEKLLAGVVVSLRAALDEISALEDSLSR